MEKLLKNKEEEFNDYYRLPPATSQQILMILDRNLKSYFSTLKMWKRNKKLLSGCPRFPKYKEKLKGRNIILIDDITTTGATLNEARKILKQAGAKKVIAFTVAH